MLNDARAAWIVAAMAVMFALLGGLVTTAFASGGLENRVKALEAREASISQKLDSIGDAVARIEGRLEKK